MSVGCPPAYHWTDESTSRRCRRTRIWRRVRPHPPPPSAGAVMRAHSTSKASRAQQITAWAARALVLAALGCQGTIGDRLDADDPETNPGVAPIAPGSERRGFPPPPPPLPPRPGHQRGRGER